MSLSIDTIFFMKLSTSISRLSSMPTGLVYLLAIIAGGLLPLSIAPFNIWPLGIVSLIILALLINQQSLSSVLWRSWFFGVGMYGIGVSWVYVSISGFGGAPIPLALVLVCIFVFFLAAAFSIPFYIFGRWFNRNPLNLLVAFPALWLLIEWLRTWLFNGFPWLFAGYAHLHTWLSGWAPLIGVMGLSFINAITAGVIAQWLWQAQKSRNLIIVSIFTALLWCAGFGLQNIQWTITSPDPITVAIVQPNMAQENKWQDDFQQVTLDLLKTQTEPFWNHKIIIWPEAAVPLIYSDALPFLNEMNRKAADNQAGLITGIIFDQQHSTEPGTINYYNSVATFGNAIGIYHKRRLVPFGEFVPLEYWLRGIIDFLNLPTSIISFGAQEQHGLKVDNLFISPYVCYEVAYPDLVGSSAIDAHILMSVSNLGWFGDSLGRHQFMEMAQMRALETQHYFAYSTNNGPSAVFDPKGNIQAQTEAFTQTTLSAKVYATYGSTPFMRWGSLPLAGICILLLLGLYLHSVKHNAYKNRALAD
jgi:apolipoprotein N-acyltransferase